MTLISHKLETALFFCPFPNENYASSNRLFPKVLKSVGSTSQVQTAVVLGGFSRGTPTVALHTDWTDSYELKYS